MIQSRGRSVVQLVRGCLQALSKRWDGGSELVCWVSESERSGCSEDGGVGISKC